MVARFLTMEQFTPLSEWSAPPVRLEDFVRSAAWQVLPFDIRVALARIWLREQAAHLVSARMLWTTATIAEGPIRESAEHRIESSR